MLFITTDFRRDDTHSVYFSLGHVTAVMRRRLAQFLADRRFARAYYLVEERESNPQAIVDALRLVPELDRRDPSFDLRIVVKPLDGVTSPRHYFEALHARIPPDHMQVRLDKYRHIPLADLERGFTFVNALDDALAAASAPCVWVLEFSRSAAEALDWCAAHGIAVPAGMSIVCLENDHHYAGRAITCCIRDWDRMGYLMAHALMGDIPLRLSRRGFVDFDAPLLERRTTPP